MNRIIFNVIFLTLLTGLVCGAGQVGDGLYQIKLSGGPDKVQIGEEIHLSGQVAEEYIGGSVSDVIILLTAPQGSLKETFVLSTPDNMGLFSYVLNADVVGKWGFEALYSGFYSQSVEIEVIPLADEEKTTLTLNSGQHNSNIGEEVPIDGRLSDASGNGIPDREIVYEIAEPDTTNSDQNYTKEDDWVTAGAIETDRKGEYHFYLPIERNGTMVMRTRYIGDDQYLEAESQLFLITVNDNLRY